MSSLAERPEWAALQSFIEKVGGGPAPDIENFMALFRRVELGKGEFFVRMGEETHSVAFIYSGIARMFYTREDGKDFVKSFMSAPGMMSALESLITGEPPRLMIQAVTEMVLLVVPYAEIRCMYEQHMYWQRLGRHIIEYVYVKKVRREAALLMDSAAERYQTFMAEHRAVAEQVPDYQIAAYLGITPEALSRLKRAALKRKAASK